MKTFSKTDVGVVREVNQDYVSVAPGPIGNMPNLLVVADGMGGHQAGDYASRQTVETVMHEVRTSGETEPEAMLLSLSRNSLTETRHF